MKATAEIFLFIISAIAVISGTRTINITTAKGIKLFEPHFIPNSSLGRIKITANPITEAKNKTFIESDEDLKDMGFAFFKITLF